MILGLFVLLLLVTYMYRYGYVFMYLDTPMTLARYEPQFINYAHYISSYGLVRSIIVNEHYIRGNSEQLYVLILL